MQKVEQPELIGPTIEDQIKLIPALRKQLEKANDQIDRLQDWREEHTKDKEKAEGK